MSEVLHHFEERASNTVLTRTLLHADEQFIVFIDERLTSGR